MNDGLSRREFVAVSAAAGIGLAAGGRTDAAPFKTTLHKALIVKAPTEKALQAVKDAGFEGVETRAGRATPEQAAAARKVAEKLGVRIHSVMGGGSPQGILAAQAYGADAVLHVPGRLGKAPMPKPWDFDVEFDQTTGHLTRVAKGDNAPYQQYIEGHNKATDQARASVAKLIPVAEKAKVVIALENVWNNLWVTPELLKWLVASFQSPWVRAYYDIGNHVKYGVPSETWIRTLGTLIAKVHVKDFKADRTHGRGGAFVSIRDGDVNWPAVRKALDEIGYNGWMTIEGSGGLSSQEKNKRLDLIIAGK